MAQWLQPVKKAILLDSENATAHYLYAEACKGQGDDVNTIAVATKAISIDNKQGNAYCYAEKPIYALSSLAKLKQMLIGCWNTQKITKMYYY